MFRRRSRKLRLLAVDSVKNIYQATFTVTGSSVAVATIATGDIPTNCTLANQGGGTPKVEQGSKIMSFELFGQVYFTNNPAAIRHFVIFVRRNKGGYLPVPVVADAIALGAKQWKTQIYHLEQAQPSQIGGEPMTFHIRLRVPRSVQRMEVGDVWELVFIPVDVGAGDTWDACVFGVYKWYR